MPVAEALDRVLEILRTTELYSPQLGTKDEDPHTSDLVGGLMTVSTKHWCGFSVVVTLGKRQCRFSGARTEKVLVHNLTPTETSVI